MATAGKKAKDLSLRDLFVLGLTPKQGRAKKEAELLRKKAARDKNTSHK